VRIALDTNTYRAFMVGEHETVRLVRQSEQVWLPVPVLAELRFGFRKGTRSRANEAALTRFLDSPRVGVLHCDEHTSHYYAELKLQLTRQATPIPINDVWIAALVLQHGLAIHTLDHDFDRIPQLARV
jgi:tRNA(fMet)-specific endonuclease VapC